jgi:hypothetical protein
MPALVAGIHVFGPCSKKDVDGTKVGLVRLSVTSPAMTMNNETR